MKATLTVTSRGVVTLPAKLRKALGLRADDLLIAETTPEGLLLRPAVTLPVEMYGEKRIREFDEAEADLEKALRRKKQAARQSVADEDFHRLDHPVLGGKERWRRAAAAGAPHRRAPRMLGGRLCGGGSASQPRCQGARRSFRPGGRDPPGMRRAGDRRPYALRCSL